MLEALSVYHFNVHAYVCCVCVGVGVGVGVCMVNTKLAKILKKKKFHIHTYI